MGNNPLQGTVLFHLPAGVSLREIRAHAGLRCGLNRAWGETYLLVTKTELLVLTRDSVFDEYQRIQVAPAKVPRLEAGASHSDLFVETQDGQVHRLTVTAAERPAIEKLLQTYETVRAAPPAK